MAHAGPSLQSVAPCHSAQKAVIRRQSPLSAGAPRWPLPVLSWRDLPGGPMVARPLSAHWVPGLAAPSPCSGQEAHGLHKLHPHQEIAPFTPLRLYQQPRRSGFSQGSSLNPTNTSSLPPSLQHLLMMAGLPREEDTEI